MIHFDFSEKLAVVTGGTRGIGRAISEAFLAAGARVIATYGFDTATAEEFTTAAGTKRLETVQCNVADYAAVEAFFTILEDRGEELHVLVNNAGIRRDQVLAMMPPDDWEQVIKVNLSGVYNMCKFAVQNMMRQRWGRIINITSPQKDYGFSGQANYAATKAGLVGLTRSLSREVAKRKITVNCVSPGFIETDLIKDLPDATKKEYKGMVPLRRFGKPEEVAPVVLFLSSDEAAYVTGTVYDVSGGL